MAAAAEVGSSAILGSYLFKSSDGYGDGACRQWDCGARATWQGLPALSIHDCVVLPASGVGDVARPSLGFFFIWRGLYTCGRARAGKRLDNVDGKGKEIFVGTGLRLDDRRP